jgi:hypothetical protein
MRTLQTKEARTNLLNSIIERRQTQGYKLETFKGLQILTKAEDGKWFLEVYQDNSTKPLLNYYYRVEAQMLQRIEQTKQNYTSRSEWKAKRKAEQSGRLTGAAACADAIRAELKTVLPHIKFSVRSETFAGGDAVRISWEDGATVDEVENVTGKYQSGHFNGMEDIYEYSNRNSDLPQVKYITESRKMSAEAEAILNPIAKELFESFGSNEAYNCRGWEQFLYRVFVNCSFPKGATVTGIIPTGETCGINTPEKFYKLGFDVPQVEQPTPQAKQAQQTSADSSKISVVEYGRGLAVVGNTKPIKEELKAIGGRFNKFLTVGVGWVFPLSKLEEIKALLTQTAQSKANEGQPTEPKPTEPTLNDEIKKTVDFFVQTDLAIYGQVQQSTYEAAKMQEVEVEEYTTLTDIQQAAQGGKVISLCNLSQLVNQK